MNINQSISLNNRRKELLIKRIEQLEASKKEEKIRTDKNIEEIKNDKYYSEDDKKKFINQEKELLNTHIYLCDRAIEEAKKGIKFYEKSNEQLVGQLEYELKENAKKVKQYTEHLKSSKKKELINKKKKDN